MLFCLSGLVMLILKLHQPQQFGNHYIFGFGHICLIKNMTCTVNTIKNITQGGGKYMLYQTLFLSVLSGQSLFNQVFVPTMQ